MTIRNSAQNPVLVEMGRDRIVAHFRDGAVVVDDDVASETHGKTVDYFIKPNNTPDDHLMISIDERFRPAAGIWGDVRDRLATERERSLAQGRLNHSLAEAHDLIREFRWGVEHGTVSLEKHGFEGAWTFFYKNENGDRHSFRVELSPGRIPAIQSLTLEDEDGMRVAVRDSILLRPFQKALRPLLAQYRRLGT